MQVQYQPEVDKNLKQVFGNQAYWDPIFRNLAPVIPPIFRVFKTSVSDYSSKQPYFKGLNLEFAGRGDPIPQEPKCPAYRIVLYIAFFRAACRRIAN
ncbi:hypothetical protein FGO68_gene9621 [Halteria grandinella]|uniref:Uncharacterized protein n=1 Tax=Halteria grandinella TaxID=5974 RepID=A0A8J8P382_HALGN|nr:hypothetical protein FGO68_gene9621 [Halteria grandinella]